MILTVKTKLLSTPEQNKVLLRTMKVFNEACNFISQIAWKEKVFRQMGLHRLCYRSVRNQFGLSAQHAVRAIGKVVESYRAEKKRLHVFKKLSAVVYDERIMSFKGAEIVSLLTVAGRTAVPFVYRPDIILDKSIIKGQADLIFKRGIFSLCICVEVPEKNKVEPAGTLGVDFGIINLATTSDQEIFSGKDVDRVRERITTLKRALQRRGTKSAKRHLKKLSGREARFKRNTNHIISKQIVRTAEGTCRAIAIEDLKGFSGRKTVNRAARERFGKWAFGQLRTFIEYKAILRGVPVLHVNPRNTSRTCSVCGHVSKSNRKSQSLFSCSLCGTTLNADINAAINIAQRASVNTPIAVHAPALHAPFPGTASRLL